MDVNALTFMSTDVHHTERVLLDESTHGVDIGSKAQIYETVARCAEEGNAVLLVRSYLPPLFGLCDGLAVMSRRQLSAARIEEWCTHRDPAGSLDASSFARAAHRSNGTPASTHATSRHNSLSGPHAPDSQRRIWPYLSASFA